MKGEEYLRVRPFLKHSIINMESKAKVPDEYSIYNYVRKVRLKNGNYTDSVLNWYNPPDIVDGPFSRITIEEPSISKRQKIIDQLLSYGWKPNLFTDKGLPKLTEKGQPVDTLEEVGDFGKALASWYTLNHRQSQIRGFLPHVRSNSRIAAQCNPCGTNTFRAKHKVVANIPRPTSTFGKEMRSLFGVGEGRVFVGADLSGLELRVLAHHMKDDEYINQILTGDIHSYNQNKAQLLTRDQAKTFIYALAYGAGNEKLGSIVGGGSKKGQELKETFFTGIPKLRTLTDKVQAFAKKRGWLPSIDGRKIYVRSFEGKILVHTALNTLLQADGSIIAKRAMVIADEEIRRRGLDAKQIIYYHDEFAYDTLPELGEEVGEILIDSMRLAGEYYNLNIPIAGEYKIGYNWGVH
jgi:DNA polymerase-1